MTIKNRDPQILLDLMDIISGLMSSYGWYVLAFIFISVFIWRKYLSIIIYKMRQNEDPEVIVSRAEQIERARRRQQEIYNKQMEEFKQKEEEKQNHKKQELIELEKSIDPNKDTNDLRKRNTKTLRDNTSNPLMGYSSGTTYRPSRSCGPSKGG